MTGRPPAATQRTYSALAEYTRVGTFPRFTRKSFTLFMYIYVVVAVVVVVVVDIIIWI